MHVYIIFQVLHVYYYHIYDTYELVLPLSHETSGKWKFIRVPFIQKNLRYPVYPFWTICMHHCIVVGHVLNPP